MLISHTGLSFYVFQELSTLNHVWGNYQNVWKFKFNFDGKSGDIFGLEDLTMMSKSLLFIKFLIKNQLLQKVFKSSEGRAIQVTPHKC